ncbi:hypothetical protein BD410DRAFT_787807 [Rickenella mellea]|uniref:Uncharacterized protein n=1 Tax=Rickenella mellea TaxID=50990 RepID=A0A4Y7Q783_9AGAM|nr:hypothetical protein BD410DRAFT_787807 [Rickenella mellea]
MSSNFYLQSFYLFLVMLLIGIPVSCLLLERSEVVGSQPIRAVATLISIVVNPIATYPLRAVTRRATDPQEATSINNHHHIVAFMFFLYTFAIAVAVDTWSATHSIRINPTIINWIYFIVGFYAAEFFFRLCVSVGDPELGSFSTLHTRLWDLWGVFRAIFWVAVEKVYHAGTDGSQRDAMEVVNAPANTREEASIPPPYSVQETHSHPYFLSMKPHDDPHSIV